MWRFSKQFKFQSGALLAAMLLSACGGGADTGVDPQPSSPAAVVAQPVALPGSNLTPQNVVADASVLPTQAETILVTPINNGDGIRTAPVLKKTNGTVVATLEDLPEGVTNSDWMKKTNSRLPLRIVLANGTYFLKAPWVWTHLQSGRAESPITVEAQTSGGVIISGAKVVTVSTAAHQGAARVIADLSDAGLGNVEQLWVNGGRAVLARAPNLGNFFYVKKSLSSWAGSNVYDGVPVNLQVFNADPASLTYLDGLTQQQRAAAVLVAVQSWTAGHHRIQESQSNGDVRVSPPAKWPFLNPKFGFAQRYFIENVPTALDAPGEWYFDAATNRLTYLPHAAQKQANVVFSIPRVRQLLQLKAQASTNKWVEYINFKGLKFRYAQVPLPEEGFNDGQAAMQIESAVLMDSVRHVALSDCEISRVGGYGIWLRQNVKNVKVTGCEIFDTGAGGIKIGMAYQPVDTNATSYNTVQDNRIHATGFQFPGGVGVWVGQSSYNSILDNLIGDTTYTAISLGWTWGYGESQAHHNVVARNFLYNIMQGALSDGAGIYTLGISRGTEIKGNVIKNVRGFSQYGAGAWGLYNDEGSSHIVMDSNVVVGTDNGGYVMHYGQHNTVSNNVLARGDQSEVQVTKAETVNQVNFDRNYIVPTMPAFIAYGGSTNPVTSYTGNLVSGQFVPSILSPKECGSGCTVTQGLAIQSSELFDVPKLTMNGAPVTLPGSMPPYRTAAAITPYVSPSSWWAVTAANVPSRAYEFDATTADFGTAPSGMKVVPAEHPDLISVIRNADGEKCLAFRDGAKVAHAWEPYSLIETDYASGKTTVTFTLKADSTTEFIHEWRNYRGNPYLTGPRIVFSAARGIEVADKKVADLPVGKWITVTVTSRQGSKPTWDMSIKHANGTSLTALSSQQPLDAEWTTTKAVFFISNATVPSSTCLGKIGMSNQ